MASKDLVSWILHQIAHRASCSFIILPPPKKNQYDATQWLPSFTELLRRLGGSGRRKTMCTDLSHWIRVSIHEVHVPVAQKKNQPSNSGSRWTCWNAMERDETPARCCTWLSASASGDPSFCRRMETERNEPSKERGWHSPDKPRRTGKLGKNPVR